MIIEFFKNEKSIDALLNYLLGTSNQPREKAYVMSGCRESMKLVVDNMTQKRKYSAGVLSFEELGSVSEKTKYEIMKDFESMVFAGLDDKEHEVLWVEHTDKGRLELNFVIAKCNVVTGKSFNPFYFKADVKTFDAWRDLTNFKYGLSSPKDPSKKRDYHFSEQYIVEQRQESGREAVAMKERLKTKKDIHAYLSKLVADEVIKSRDELVDILEKNGYEIARKGKEYISIKNPMNADGRNLRLSGDIYSNEFYSQDKSLREVYSPTLDELVAEYEKRLAKRTEFNQKTYNKKKRPISETAIVPVLECVESPMYDYFVEKEKDYEQILNDFRERNKDIAKAISDRNRIIQQFVEPRISDNRAGRSLFQELKDAFIGVANSVRAGIKRRRTARINRENEINERRPRAEQERKLKENSFIEMINKPDFDFNNYLNENDINFDDWRFKDDSIVSLLSKSTNKKNHLFLVKEGYCLNDFVEDDCPEIRIEIAKQGFALDELAQDKDINVRNAVHEYRNEPLERTDSPKPKRDRSNDFIM